MGRFIKGLVKDTSPADQPQGTWRFARNVIVNKVDGAVSNEGGNKAIVKIGRRLPIFSSVTTPGGHGNPASVETVLTGWQEASDGYSVIGTIETTDDRVVIFSVNRYIYSDPTTGEGVFSDDYGRSEIGIYKAGAYHTVLNVDPELGEVDTDLKFTDEHPISGTYKINAQGNLFVYWTDNFNPARCLNISRQESSSSLVPTEFVYGVDPETSPNKNYIDRLNLFPHSGPVPHVEFDSINSGGGLVTGAYSLALAYVDADLVATNFLTVDNPVYITDDIESVLPIERYDGAEPGSQTGKSISWAVTNINTDYEYLRPVVIQTVEGVRKAYQLNDVEITALTGGITFTGVEGYTEASVEDVIIDTVSYNKVKSIEQLDGVMYTGNLEGTLDVGFQKYAADITLKPRLKELNDFDIFSIVGDNMNNGFVDVAPPEADRDNGYKSILNAYKYKGYTRDEVYAFYIAFILNDGSMSYAYHIPGRKAEGSELDTMSSDYSALKSLGPNENAKNFNFLDTSGSSTSEMNYWRNLNETYPTTGDYDSDGFADTDGARMVRHHHFPSNSTEYRFYTSSGGITEVTEPVSTSLQWESPAGGSNVVYNNNDAADLFLDFDGSASTSVVAMIVTGFETMTEGEEYTISWWNNNWGDPEYNTWTGELLATTNDGWCLFDTSGNLFDGENSPNSVGNSESNWGGATIIPEKGSDSGDYMEVTAGTTSSTVQILGFELNNIVIPPSIADKVQGFRVYYAKREHKNKTILGQGIVTPYWATETQIGGCKGDEDGLDLGNGNKEDLWVKYPFHTSAIYNNWEDFDAHLLNKEGLRTLAFYSFELLRTKDSIAAATHFSVEGETVYHTWLGAGVTHASDDATCTTGLVRSTFGVLKNYLTSSNLTADKYRVLNERCKTYVKGNSIFDARGLGFGYKLYNRGGESHIALGVSKSQAIPTDFFEEGSSITEWNLGGVPFNYINGVKIKTQNINLRAFKTDVYNSLDSQTLVWTGFEVVGDDLNYFLTQGDGQNSNSTNAVSAEGVFGGDTFLCRYGVRQSLYPRLNNAYAVDRVAGFYTIVETTDNINFRHETGSSTTYFPGSPAKKLLFADKAGKGHDTADFYDYTKQESTKYNIDYSMDNDIRPAIPLPLLTSQPTSFPTRIQRSAKSDPGSLVDNFRVFLALQYKDMPKNRGSLWSLASFNNLLYMHMEDSLYVTKGKEKLQLGGASEAYIGSGDIFAQEPDELIQTEAGHGGTRSQYSSLVTKYGYFSTDRRNSTVYLTGKSMQDIGNLGMEKWFKKNMPFYLQSEYGYIATDDNPVGGLGYTSIWDDPNQRMLLTKRDLVPTRDFQRRFNSGRPTTDALYEEYIPDEVITEEGSSTTETVDVVSIDVDDIDFTALADNVYVAPLIPTYTLSHDQSGDNVIQEGVTVVFTLTTTNLADGPVAYSVLGGVTSADITIDGQSNPSLVGTFNIVGGTASITIVALADNTTEAGTESLQVSLKDVSESLSVNIEDTSHSPSVTSISSSVGSVNEPGSSVISIVTAGIADGVTIGYTITGIQEVDITGSLTGNFTVNSNAASLTITTIEDYLSEGVETLTLTLAAPYNNTVQITINDTSETPVDPSIPIVGVFNALHGGIVVSFMEAPDGGYSGYVVGATDLDDGGDYTSYPSIAMRLAGDLTEETFSDWYIPTVTELEEIYTQSTQNGGLISGMTSTSYWTSSMASEWNRHTVNFSDGSTGGSGSQGNNTDYRVRPVRHFNTTGSPQVGVFSPEFGGIVGEFTGNSTDGYTGFVVNTVDAPIGNWDTATTNAAALGTNGVTWELPTIEQLETILSLHDTLTGPFSGDFYNSPTPTPLYYWSSSEVSNSHAWALYFGNGQVSSSLKTSTSRSRVISNFDTTPQAVVTYAVGDYIESLGGYVAFVEANGLEGFVVADTDFTDAVGDSTLDWNIWNGLAPFTFEGTEWQWPTKKQLLNVYDSHTTLEAQAGFNAFTTSSYWSSTEDNSSHARYVSFNSGYTSSTLKTNSLRVRGIKTFDYSGSRTLSSHHNRSTGITYSLEGVGENIVNLNSVTANSFTLEHLVEATGECGVKVFIPNSYLAFPIDENDTYTHTVSVNLTASNSLLAGTGIVLGDVPVVNEAGEAIITSTEKTFTPIATENGFEVYFKVNLDKNQIVQYTLDGFQIVRTTTTTITTGAVNANLTQNGAIVLNRSTNNFELIGYTESPKYRQTRTVVDVSEISAIQGVKQFSRTGWTASYYPEGQYWTSFHDYVPSIYTYDSGHIYSFDNDIPDPNLQEGEGLIWGDSLLTGIIFGGEGYATLVDGTVFWGVPEATVNSFWWGLNPTLLDVEETYQISMDISATGEDLSSLENTSGVVFSLTVNDSILQSITAEELLEGTISINVQISGVVGIVQLETAIDNLIGFGVEITNTQVLPLSHWESSPTFHNMWQHDDYTEPGNFYGTLFPFEVEFIDNTERQTTKLFSSFGYETNVFSNSVQIFKDGFSNFYVYNTSQMSGIKDLKYFGDPTTGVDIRKVGSEWRVNDFRDMTNLVESPNDYALGTILPDENIPMVNIDGMYESVNSLYIDENKLWHQQKKFTDTFVGIRLINDNSHKILVDLYSTSVAMRKYNR